MLEECAAERREPLPTAGTRGAPDRHGRRTCRRSRLRPPDGVGGPYKQGPSHTSRAPTSSPRIPRRKRDKRPSLSYFKKLLSFPKEPRQERGGSGPRPDHQFQEGQGPVGWP